MAGLVSTNVGAIVEATLIAQGKVILAVIGLGLLKVAVLFVLFWNVLRLLFRLAGRDLRVKRNPKYRPKSPPPFIFTFAPSPKKAGRQGEAFVPMSVSEGLAREGLTVPGSGMADVGQAWAARFGGDGEFSPVVSDDELREIQRDLDADKAAWYGSDDGDLSDSDLDRAEYALAAAPGGGSGGPVAMTIDGRRVDADVVGSEDA